MKISEHFTSKELGITNEYRAWILINMCSLVHNVLEPLGTLLNEPIIITSGFRTIEENKRVGGVINSQHLTGQAVDFTCKSISKAFETLVNGDITFDQLIYYRKRKFIHISYSHKNNRKQIIIKP